MAWANIGKIHMDLHLLLFGGETFASNEISLEEIYWINFDNNKEQHLGLQTFLPHFWTKTTKMKFGMLIQFLEPFPGENIKTINFRTLLKVKGSHRVAV